MSKYCPCIRLIENYTVTERGQERKRDVAKNVGDSVLARRESDWLYWMECKTSELKMIWKKLL